MLGNKVTGTVFKSRSIWHVIFKRNQSFAFKPADLDKTT